MVVKEDIAKIPSLIKLSSSIDGVKASFFTLIYSFFALARVWLTAALILGFCSFELIQSWVFLFAFHPVGRLSSIR
jgi:hypothetical protein